MIFRCIATYDRILKTSRHRPGEERQSIPDSGGLMGKVTRTREKKNTDCLTNYSHSLWLEHK